MSTVTTRDRPARMADESARGKDAPGSEPAFDRPTPASGANWPAFACWPCWAAGPRGRSTWRRRPSWPTGRSSSRSAPLQGGEHRLLARLQHTHIVPILSSQDLPERGLRILCLPYLGGTTLEHLLDELASRPPAERSGRDLLEVLDRAANPAVGLAPDRGTRARVPGRGVLRTVDHVGSACAWPRRSTTRISGTSSTGMSSRRTSSWRRTACPCCSTSTWRNRPCAPGGARPGWIGGTPPFIAPEQFAALVALTQGRPPRPSTPGRTSTRWAMVLHIALADERPSDENPDRRPIASGEPSDQPGSGRDPRARPGEGTPSALSRRGRVRGGPAEAPRRPALDRRRQSQLGGALDQVAPAPSRSPWRGPGR